MKQPRCKYIIYLIMVLIGTLLHANVALAGGSSVTLSMPTENQAFKPGDTVTINGTALNLTEVTVTVFNSADGLEYSAQPGVTDGQFSTGFTLPGNAITGTYTICIGGTGLISPYERCFLVQQNTSAPSVTVTQPTLNQVFSPGSEVFITGTALNLNEVSLTVYNSADGLEYSAQPIVTAGQFSTNFTLPSNAITGSYIIYIGGTNLTAVERTFQVQQSSTSPSVALTLPTADQIYHPGDTITINGTAQLLSQVTVTILDGTNTPVYTTPTPLTVTDGLFSTSYTLPTGAAVGNYKIQITGTGLSSPYERSLVVQTDNCFIATAAYGSKFQPSVALLRQFRDHFLMTNNLGRNFVAFYYKNSPPIADYIRKSELSKAIVRVLLTPAVGIAYLMFHPRLLYALMIFFTIVLLLWIKNRIKIPFST